jgi:hypothetical protein
MSSPEPDLPKDPAAYRPRPLLGLGFWVMIAFGVLCILAGVGVATLAPKLFPARSAPPAAPAAPPPSAPAPGAVALAPIAAPPAEPDELARLNARIATLESQGARSSEAAAAALAAAEVVEASQGSRPFARQISTLRAAAPGLPELASLERLAEIGAPSRAALALSFPDYAARAAARAYKPAPDDGLAARIAYAARKVVTIRRVDEPAGPGPDARLARAEQALADGDVGRALRELDGLPPAAQRALEPWREGAERRAEIDRQVTALRARAVHDLAPPAPASQALGA